MPAPIRHAALGLARIGATGEALALTGMLFGLAAGASFLWTVNGGSTHICWLVAAVASSLRLFCTVTGESLNRLSGSRTGFEDESYRLIPERVSDATILIGLGFAESSNPWLGLSSALLAILSSYLRSIRDIDPNRGIMKRTHRLVIVIAVALLMLTPLPPTVGPLGIPVWGLGLISAGCVVTSVLRWTNCEHLVLRQEPADGAPKNR